MRGEYNCRWLIQYSPVELPPRARRIHVCGLQSVFDSGTTSACAENTLTWTSGLLVRWNYLRVRGEYGLPMQAPGTWGELPPRARRIHHYKRYGLHWSGTTSACAENTPFERLELRLIWNYLRVRGEYPIGGILSGRPRELPPRARRIPAFKARWRCRLGTTSACAENTKPRGTAVPLSRNYLRVRGEYAAITS